MIGNLDERVGKAKVVVVKWGLRYCLWILVLSVEEDRIRRRRRRRRQRS